MSAQNASFPWARDIRPKLQKTTLTLLMLVFGLLMFTPFLWMASSSLKNENAIFDFPMQLFPEQPTLRAYETVLGLNDNRAMSVSITRAYLNSIAVVIPSVIGPLITGVLAAYAFSRLRFPGREALFALYLVTMIVPIQVLIVPRFMIANWLGIYNSLWALIIPNLSIAYATFLLRQSFMAIPQDLIDAARIDGANHLRVVWNVMVPSSSAILAALALLIFIWRWNDFTMPLIMINRAELYTLPLAIGELILDKYQAQWAGLMAGTLISTLPLFIIFAFTQRFFVRSLVHTGVKG
jgi:multiple sugar transport system permease protein